jgi:hypothetical protein
LKHSKLFSPFLKANQNSLTHLQLPNYACSTTDFKLVTAVCTQLEVLELDCEKVSETNLLKVVKLKNMSEIKIKVSAKCFTPKLLSSYMENTAIKTLKVSSSCHAPNFELQTQIFDLKNGTELELSLSPKLTPEEDLHSFLFLPQITKLKLNYKAKLKLISTFEELPNLPDLHLDFGYEDIQNMDYFLLLLDMAKQKNLQTFRVTYSPRKRFCYTPHSFSLQLLESFKPKDISQILEKLKIFNLENLSLNTYTSLLGTPRVPRVPRNFQPVCHKGTPLQAIIGLKTLKRLHLSVSNKKDESHIKKAAFENLENLKFLSLHQVHDRFSQEVTWGMGGTHGCEITSEGSSVFVP